MSLHKYISNYLGPHYGKTICLILNDARQCLHSHKQGVKCSYRFHQRTCRCRHMSMLFVDLTFRRTMFLTETVNVGVSTALFLHAVFKVVVNCVCDICRLSSHNEKSSDRLGVTTAAAQGHSCQLPENLPSVVDIKRALPKSCFESRLSTSMYYLFKDSAQV